MISSYCIESAKENVYEAKNSEYIYIYNTYPVFLKIREDINNGIYLYDDLKGSEWKQISNNLVVFIDKLNVSLSEFIITTYLKGIKNEDYFKDIDINGGYKIEERIYGSYKLIFVRTNKRLFFVNYISKNICVNDSWQYLIPDIPKSQYHIWNINHDNDVYKTINTFNAFVPFAKKRSIQPSRKLNYDFFGSFQNSLNLEENKEKKEIEEKQKRNPNCIYIRLNGWGEKSIKEISVPDMIFKYILLKDVIIIFDYNDELHAQLESTEYKRIYTIDKSNNNEELI